MRRRFLLFSENNIIFIRFVQLSTLQDWCETPLKTDDAEIQKALKDEKSTESKQFIEAIAVMSILSEANCKMPAFLHINLKLNDGKSRDKYFELFVNTVKAFAKNYSKISNGRGIVAALTTDEKPLKRSRRAAGDDVNALIDFFFDFFKNEIQHIFFIFNNFSIVFHIKIG